jgi:hypothetical protein
MTPSWRLKPEERKNVVRSFPPETLSVLSLMCPVRNASLAWS